MNIYEEDLYALLGYNYLSTPVPILGDMVLMNSSGGAEVRPVIEVEVTLLRNRLPEQRMTPWTRIPCTVRNGAFKDFQSSAPRLDGPAIRHLLYTASAPKSNREIKIGTSIREVTTFFNVPKASKRTTLTYKDYGYVPSKRAFIPAPTAAPKNLPPLKPLPNPVRGVS